MKYRMVDPNFPTDEQGRVYHISVKRGQVANRIVTAGDSVRVRRFAQFLDKDPTPFENLSARGFLTITGRYKGVPVTLVAIGMGYPMMDFLVRECRAVVEGDLAIIRFGSCGSLDPTLAVGSIGVPANVMNISTNYDHWHAAEADRPPPFLFSKPISSDPILHDHLLAALKENVASETCEIRDIKLHASADTFYSSQGRIDESFVDDNQQLITGLTTHFPELSSMEMETGHLYHLASIASPSKGHIAAVSCHMIFASRVPPHGHGHGEDVVQQLEQSFITPQQVEQLEPVAGRACLEAVVGYPIPEDRLHPTEDSVWAL
ncbi:purine and uridine phosphorylase [Meredithblackwellia eburnea MCA 4105]